MQEEARIREHIGAVLIPEEEQAIRDLIAERNKADAQLAEHQRLQQIAKEIIEQQITDEQRLANAIRDVEAARAADMLTAAQAAERVRELELEGNKLYQAAQSMKDEFASTFTDIITGAESAGDAFVNLAKQIEKAIVQALVLRAIEAGIGAAFGGGGDGALQAVVSAAGISYAPLAKGGVVDRPTLVSPTQYAGESGPEAVLPLARNGRGQLGVIADGIGGEQGPPVIINIIDNRKDGEAVEQRESRGPNGERQIDIIIESKINKLADQGRLDGAMRRNYGLTRTGSGR